MTARTRPTGQSVAVIGGGLAGIAAAAAAAESGFQVELFEARRVLGGRAGSFRDAAGGGLVDLCQHVAMGCCTHLADLCRRMEIDGSFRRQRRLDFIGPNGGRYAFAATPLLPAPLHLAAALMRLGYLSWTDRRRIVRTLLRLAGSNPEADGDRQTIGAWLRRQGESDEAIQRFWSLVLVSALAETLDRASLAAARKVFVDGFLASRRAYEMLVPKEPLAEIFDREGGDWLARRGVAVRRGVKVRRLEGNARRVAAVELADGSRRGADFFVLAVPWWNVRSLVPPHVLAALPGLEAVSQIEPAPITAVHLWLDRPITPLANAALVGRLGQWMFRPAWTANPSTAEAGHYHQVVISASHELVDRPEAEVAAAVWDELRSIWPAAGARLLRRRVVTNRRAVFSVRPGIDRLRPEQATPLANLALAGDWTATGWPATMEGAVRSGYRAVEAILAKAGRPRRIAVPDLPRGLLARWLIPSV